MKKLLLFFMICTIILSAPLSFAESDHNYYSGGNRWITSSIPARYSANSNTPISFDLPAGEYIVGEDFPAGTYSITTDAFMVVLNVYKNSSKWPYADPQFIIDPGNPVGKLKLSTGQLIETVGGILSFREYRGIVINGQDEKTPLPKPTSTPEPKETTAQVDENEKKAEKNLGATQGWICSNCNKHVTSRFCPDCGAPSPVLITSEQNQSTSPSPVITSSPTPSPSPTPTAMPAPTAEPTLAPTPSPSPTPTPLPSPTPELVHFKSDSGYKIVLSETAIELFPNDSKQVKATIEKIDNSKSGNVSLDWSSSDETIATVNKNGQIKAVAPGTAVITCASSDDPEIYSIMFVSVIKPVTGLSIFIKPVASQPNDLKTVSLFSNDNNLNTLVLVSIVEPHDAFYHEVFWSSSDEKVVTVNENGKLTAVGPGSAIITAATLSNAGKKIYKATCKVTVSIRVKEVKGDNYRPSVSIGKTLKLSPEVLPKDATNKKLKWHSSNEKVATVDQNGTVKGIKNGISEITCESEDGGAKRIFKVTVKQPITGIKAKDKLFYSYVDTSLDLNYGIETTPANATDKSITWKIESYDKTVLPPSAVGDQITFTREGKYKVTASVNDNPKIKASFDLTILPADGNTLKITKDCYASWENASRDRLKIKIQVENMSYGLPVKVFELCLYVTDAWGARISGIDQYYYLTTDKTVNAGKRVYSKEFTLPNRSKIANVYVGIHKVKLWDDSIITYDEKEMDFSHFEIN